MPRRCSWLLLGVLALYLAPLADAYVTAPTHLGGYLNDATFVVVGKVDKIFPDKPALIIKIQEDLKGKAPFRELPILFKGDTEAAKEDHVPQLLKRLAPDLPLILLINQRGKKLPTFAYTDGTWFQVIGQQTGPNQVAWALTHGEPYLRRTYKGSTKELRQLIIDHLAGKAKLPNLNEKEPPGFGPELPAKSSRRPAAGGGPLFAVIPTLGVGAPLLVLAALFPAVFGGVLVLFRQWVAFITVFSINSTLLILHMLLGPILLRDTWWNTDAALWFTMTVVALLGTVLAWRRQLANLALGPLAVEAPRKTEYLVLGILSAVCLLIVAVLIVLGQADRNDTSWVLTVVLAVGIWAGALYRLLRGTAGTALATEGVILAAMLLGHVGYAGWRWGQESTAAPVAGIEADKVAATAGIGAPQFVGVRWQKFPTKENGLIVSSPLLDGDHLYVAAAHTAFKGGTLLCLDRSSGEQKWSFIDDGDLKEMISSPCLVNGRLYLGEGFHDDSKCKVYSVDAATGTKLWEHPTGSQTESSPCVHDGKVYTGAGNDGLICLDAAIGTRRWQFPGPDYKGRLLRCGSGPAFANGKVYAGSGVDRNRKDDPGETAIFCLDAETGKPHWKVQTPLPSWSSPVVLDGQAYYGLGNGDLFTDADRPAGLMLCVDAETGREVWHFATPNAILDKPTVDGHHVYFSCRDGYVYCVGRFDGKERWKTRLDAPVIAAPALVRCPGYDTTAHVFAVATTGKAACLDPATGAIRWSANLVKDGEGFFSAAPRVAVGRTPSGDARQFYVAGCLGNPARGRPVVYCLEDFVRVQ